MTKEYIQIKRLKNQNTQLLVAFVTFVLLSLVLIGGIIALEKENRTLKTMILTDSEMWDTQIEFGDKGDEYYNLASDSYINADYNQVVYNCEKARDYFHNAAQEYRIIKQGLKEEGILLLYKKLLEEKVEFSLNMYEACEHFESASKYYYIYYDTNVPYDDPSFDMGGGEIDMMNEKIVAHDEAVNRHNDILAEILVEIEKLK